MRLIDADALLDFVDYYYDCTELGAIVSKWIDDAPTIDAVPREDYISMERTLARLQQGIADATDAPTIDAVAKHQLFEETSTLDTCPCYHHEPTGEPFCEMAIEALEADRPRGKWIEDGYYDRQCVCSHCGGSSGTQFDGVQPIPLKTIFCPNCGAKMEEDNNG